MAMADYYLCDTCGSKCFYDSSLNWDFNCLEEDKVRGASAKLDYCGDLAAICKKCAEDYEIVIIPRSKVE